MALSVFRSAIKEINKHGALLVFPIKNKSEPLSLWKCFYPRSPMRWEWDEKGDNRVSTLWHLREELSRSRKVVYTKWYQGRATLFSFPVFTAILSEVSTRSLVTQGLSEEAQNIYRVLEEDSPLPTKELRALSELEGELNSSAFNKALRELWSRLLIVGFGEVEEGGFPSLAVGSTRVLFEELWDESLSLGDDERRVRLGKLLGVDSPFLKYYQRQAALLKRYATSLTDSNSDLTAHG